MAAVQFKHSASSDILFPEESQDGLNDSFYSQRSASNYSTYSQEVKYIFNPQVATRRLSSQSEYSEIDNMYNNSQRNSARSNQSDTNKHSPADRLSSSSTPCGANVQRKSGLMFSDKNSSSGSSNAHYGLSIKSVGYPQRYNSSDNVATSQHNSSFESGRYPQRHHSIDALNSTSPLINNNNNCTTQKSSHGNHSEHGNLNNHSNQNGHGNVNVSNPEPPQRSVSCDSPLKTHTARIVNVGHNHKVPPKPKRLHQVNLTPDKPKDKQLPSQEIYATPVLSASKVLKKQKRNGPLPPPPPYTKPRNLNPVVADVDNFASRRRTWSPPTFSRMMGSAGSMQLQAMRCYRSNEQLDVDDTYEDLDAVSNSVVPSKVTAPQKMAASGQLVKTPHERIIKPIAFKPIITPQNRFTPQRPSPPQKPSPPSGVRPSQYPASHHSPPTGHHSVNPMSPNHAPPDRSDPALRLANHSHDDGYMSQDGIHNNSGTLNFHGTIHGSMQALDTTLDHSTHSSSQDGHSQHNGYPYKTSDTQSYASSNLSRVSSNMGGDVYNMGTPSPSDSGVGEIEAVLRSKDAEIRNLRETMEKNESAILQVYEEKRQNWQLEVQDHIAELERRSRAQQQKSFKTEQGLLMQLFTLQQERKALRLEADTHRTDKEKTEHRCGLLDDKLNLSNDRGEELNWELQQKAGEISLLKAQLKDTKEDTTNKSTDMIALRTQVRDLTLERDQQNTEIHAMAAKLHQSQEELDQLQEKLNLSQTQLDQTKQTLNTPKDTISNSATLPDSQLEKLDKELSDTKAIFLHEKEQWMDEKNKVVRYQKHLQLNYVQVMRKNKMLEDEVEQLTLELESRDIKLMTDGVAITEESIC